MESFRRLIGSTIVILSATLASGMPDANAAANVHPFSSGSGATVRNAGALEQTPDSGVISYSALKDGNFAYRPTQVLSAALGGASSGAVIPPLDPFSPPEETAVKHNEAGVGTLNATISPVPEPGTILLLAAGMIGVALWGRKRALL